MKSKSILFITLLVLYSTVYGQYGSVGVVDARSMSLAKTYTTTTSGIYSVGINPANLSFNNNDFIQLSTLLPLPSISVGTGTNFISMNDINYFFGGVNGEARYLTQQDKDRLNALFEGGGRVFASVSVDLFSVCVKPADKIGAFAFSVYDFLGAEAKVPSAIADFALSGNPVGKKFDLSEADVKGWWLRNYALSYSREIPGFRFFNSLTAGITLKLVHGYSYVGTSKNTSSFSTGTNAELTGQTNITGYSAFSDNMGVQYDFDSLSRQSDFSLFPSPAGTGLGLDIGFAATVKDVWNFSLALTDIGSIKWDKNAAQFNSFGYIYIDDISNQDQLDSAKNAITGDSKKIDHFYTSLPTTLRFGVSRTLWQGQIGFPGSLLVAFDYNQGLNEMPGNNLQPRFSVGAEWKPMNYFPYLRTGFSLGGGLGFCWAFGLGIDAGIIELHFATSDMQSVVTPNATKTLSVSFGSRWKF